MGVTRSEIFTKKQNTLAQYARVLGHPARIAILEEMIKNKTCICGDLVNEIGLAQATISQHLRELKNAGLIKGKISGTKVCYCINEKKVKQISEALKKFFSSACCCKIC